MAAQSRLIPSNSLKLHLLDWGAPANVPGDESSRSRLRGGKGFPLLLLHGLAGNVHWWDSTAPELGLHSHVVALDFRGHGDSGWDPAGRYDLDDFLQDIDSARQALGWKQMYLAAHSMGARVALEYAVRRSENLLGLIAIDFMSQPNPERFRKHMRAMRRPQPYYSDPNAILRHFRLEPPGTLLDSKALQHLAELSIRHTSQGYTWKFDWRVFQFKYSPVWPLLPQIRIPACIIRGEHSPIMSAEALKRIAEQVAGVQDVEIPGAFHHVPLDTPRLLAATILDFI